MNDERTKAIEDATRIVNEVTESDGFTEGEIGLEEYARALLDEVAVREELERELAGRREEHRHHLADTLYLKQDLDQLRTKLAETKAERDALTKQLDKVRQHLVKDFHEYFDLSKENDQLEKDLAEAKQFHESIVDSNNRVKEDLLEAQKALPPPASCDSELLSAIHLVIETLKLSVKEDCVHEYEQNTTIDYMKCEHCGARLEEVQALSAFRTAIG